MVTLSFHPAFLPFPGLFAAGHPAVFPACVCQASLAGLQLPTGRPAGQHPLNGVYVPYVCKAQDTPMIL